MRQGCSLFPPLFNLYSEKKTWTRTRITTNPDSSQRPNKSTIKNLKESKLIESSKHKKQPNLNQNHHYKKPWENKQKRRKEKRRQPSKTPKRGQKRTKERKRRKGFRMVAFFFLSSFFLCFLKVFSSGDFGPNLVVFCVLRIRLVRILEIFNCTQRKSLMKLKKNKKI